MKKFEHKVIQLGEVLPYPNSFSPMKTEKTLDELGKEGWKLVSVIAIGQYPSHALAFLRREFKE